MNRMPGVAELDCVDVREALLVGRPLSAAEAEHAAACSFCSRSLPRGDATGPSSELLGVVEASIRDETGLVAWLRALPTSVRLFAGFGLAALLAIGMALVRPRWTSGPMPVDRVATVLAVLAVLVALVVRLALRPLQAAPPSRRVVLWSVAAGLLVPVLFAVTPPGAETAALGSPGMGKGIVLCFLFGALPGVLLVLALRALDRTAHRAGDAALLAAVGGGLAGNAALELHCPSVAPLHLLLGHATVGVVLVVVYAAVRRSREPRRVLQSPD
jgi:hypothetical protein